jgi:hypothetical protein
MQTANILLSIGGDSGNTVPKDGVTASEIAVLRLIHGDEAVQEIEPAGEVRISHRAERARLFDLYGRARYADDKPVVETLFPGAAARLFENLAELEIPEEFYKATGRLKAPEPVILDAVTPSIAEQAEADRVAEADEGVGEDINDGIGEPVDLLS